MGSSIVKIRTVEIIFVFKMGISDVFIFIRSASIWRSVEMSCCVTSHFEYHKKLPLVQFGGILFRCSGPKSCLHRIMAAKGFVFEIREHIFEMFYYLYVTTIKFYKQIP